MARMYYIVSWCAAPLIVLWLRWRQIKGKEDAMRLPERFGKASLSRPAGRLIWLHAASVGESNSVIPLLDALHERYSDVNLLVTTGTVSSSKTILSRLPHRAFHQFVPVDTPQAVSRFLTHWKPDLAIWVESELWPNLIMQTHARGTKMALVNARMSDRSHKKWLRARSFFLQMTGCFDLLFAGSKEDARKYKNLGATHIGELGNLKYDAPPLPAEPTSTSEVITLMGGRHIFLAASTHEGEEDQIATMHIALREIFSDMLTVIVPRHAHRGEAIMRLMAKHKLTSAQRSKNQVILPETNIYIADTMGELGIFYRLAGIVLIGGTLVPRGGHNPIEAAQLDCAILCGPHMHNFRGICKEMIDADALIQTRTLDELTQKVTELLRDHEMQERYARTAHEFVNAKTGTVLQLSDALRQLLDAKTIAEIPSESPGL